MTQPPEDMSINEKQAWKEGYHQGTLDAAQPFDTWRGHLDNMVDALNEHYFTAQMGMYRDDDGKDPLILVIVTGEDQEDMEERFTRFMRPRQGVET